MGLKLVWRQRGREEDVKSSGGSKVMTYPTYSSLLSPL